MYVTRNTTTRLNFLAIAYLTTYFLFGPQDLVGAFVILTAIDHWHPNWVGPEPFLAAAHTLTGVAIIYLVVVVINWLAKRLFPNMTHAPRNTDVMATLRTDDTTALRALQKVATNAEDFRKELQGALLTTGMTPDQATTATQAGMVLADTRQPKDWAGPVRDAALEYAGINGQFLRVFSAEPRLVDTAQFLTDYGYMAMPVTCYGTDDHLLNFDGILVKHNTTSITAEESLIELLVYAHQAHMASMLDTGNLRQRHQVENYSKGLTYVATKLSLRGFIPPELDAEIGGDGTATAEELQRWAIAQVVATCSPISREPLTTIERTIPEEV